MSSLDLDRWLLENGGPAIRYRTATELLAGRHDADPAALEQELLEWPMVQTWLERLEPNFAFNALHGGKPNCFENTMGKLTQLGCRAGMPPLDEKIAPFLEWLADTPANDDSQAEFVTRAYSQPIVAAFLMRAGYGEEQPVAAIAQRRLNTLYEFCRQGRYDIYVDMDTGSPNYPAIPDSYRRHRLVDPDLYPNGDMCLPDLYDLHLLAALPRSLRTPETENKLEAIIDYIMQTDYQHLPEGYGIVLLDKNRYWVMGWSVHLPGYFGFPDHISDPDPAMRRLVRMLVLMAHFPAAHRYLWYRQAIAHLARNRPQHGVFNFPAGCLSDIGIGYWIRGSYMGLEENRRRSGVRELESTFWMRKIASLHRMQ